MSSLVLDCSSIPTDLILNVGGRVFNVHRFMMIIRSQYFNTMLSGGFKEKNMQSISITDIDPDIFNEFLNLVYGRPHVSSPALMFIVHMYGVTGITLNMLHKQFGVPIEQFQEYAEAMISLYPLPMEWDIIDIIASKITSADYKDHIPVSIKDEILASKKMPFYGDITIVEQLLEEAMEEKNTMGRKDVYVLNHHDVGNIGISAYGSADALLRLRHECRVQHYDSVTAEQNQYDLSITKDILEQIRMGAKHKSLSVEIAKKLPDLAPGTRYLKESDTRFDIIKETRPSMSRLDDRGDDEFFSWFKDYMDIRDDDIRSLIHSFKYQNSDISPNEPDSLLEEVGGITVKLKPEAHPTNIPNVYEVTINVEVTNEIGVANENYAVVYDDDKNMICFGRFENGVLHSSKDYEARIIEQKYDMRVFGALLVRSSQTPGPRPQILVPRLPGLPVIPQMPVMPTNNQYIFQYSLGIYEKIDTMLVDKNLNLAFPLGSNISVEECLGVYDKQSKKLMPASVELYALIH